MAVMPVFNWMVVLSESAPVPWVTAISDLSAFPDMSCCCNAVSALESDACTDSLRSESGIPLCGFWYAESAFRRYVCTVSDMSEDGIPPEGF